MNALKHILAVVFSLCFAGAAYADGMITPPGPGSIKASMLASGAAAANLGAGSIGASLLASGAAAANLGFTPLRPSNNLSEISSPATARANIGLGSISVTPLVTSRAPAAADDTTRGYSIGSAWVSSQGLFVAQRVTTGAAMWAPTVMPLPCDANGTTLAPAVCYGTKKLAAAYAGNAMTLTRGSDSATQAVGFLSNGQIDASTANNFCNAKGDAAANTCYVTVWNDQSGNAYNATASAGANAPLWNPANLVNGVPAVSFASIAHGLTNQSQTARYLTMSASFSWTPSTATWLFAGQLQNNAENKTLLETTGNIGYLSSYNNVPQICNKGNGVCVSNMASESGPVVMAMQWQSSTINIWSNNRFGTHSSTTVSSTTGGYLGSNQTGFSANFDAVAFIAYAATTTTAQVNNARWALFQATGIAPQVRDIIIGDGDSTNSGAGSWVDNSITRYAVGQTIRPVQAINMAQYGQTLSSMVTNFSTRIAPIYSSAYQNFVVHVYAGPNDIRGGATAAAVYANLQTYVAAAKALGSNVRVIVAVPMLQCDTYANGTWNSALQTLNANIRANWAAAQGAGGLGADGIADYMADPTIGPNSYASSYFCSNVPASPDGQHPTDATMQYFAPIMATAINSILYGN